MPVLKLKDAESARNAIMKQQKKQIEKLYRNAAKEVAQRAQTLRHRTNISSTMRVVYLNQLEKQLEAEISKISTELSNITVGGMTQVSQSVVNNTLSNLKMLGFSTSGLMSRVPDDVVRNIITGNVYETGWSLSKRIWGIQEKTMQDIHTVVANGIAQNKSAYDIAKDLEKYVDPRAAKQWDWSKVYPGTNKKVDYNAQRLARTLTQHAFQQATERTNDPNPFVTGYVWHSAFAHGRTCIECMDRDGTFFPKGEVPMDHPQGLCTILPQVGESLTSIANRIADWNEAEEGTYPEIDAYYDWMQRN